MFGLALACLSAVAAAQQYRYEPVGPVVFTFRAESITDSHGPEIFRVETLVRIESFAYLSPAGVPIGVRGSENGSLLPGPRPENAATLLEKAYYIPKPEDNLGWRPQIVVTYTAN